MKARLKWLITILLGLVLTGQIYLFVSSSLWPGQIHRFFGFSTAIISTGSMEPNLPVGSLIVTQYADTYQKGEVVTYLQDGTSITHRIVEVSADGYQTKGDANQVSDGLLVQPRQVVGKVIFSLPYVGWLRQPWILLLIALIYLFYLKKSD